MPESAHGWRLDKTLGLLLPEAEWGLRARRRLCDRGLVLVGNKIGTPGTKVRAGQAILLLDDPEAPAAPGQASGQPSDQLSGQAPGQLFGQTTACPVAHDAELVALFKPVGLHSVALTGSQAPSLEALLPALLQGLPPAEDNAPAPDTHAGTPVAAYTPVLLNRLDVPTSGLVLVARAQEGERRWRRAERLGLTDKLYLAIIEGQPLYDFTVCRRLDTDNRIRTRVRSSDDPDPLRHTDVTLLHGFTLAEAPGLATGFASCAAAEIPLMLVGCRIRKGARHQIRAHLAAAGHPLLGDVLYGGTPFPTSSEQAPAVLPDTVADTVPPNLSTPPSRFFLHHGRVSLPGFTAFCRAPWLDLLPEPARAVAG